jgi:hypothetical protein
MSHPCLQFAKGVAKDNAFRLFRRNATLAVSNISFAQLLGNVIAAFGVSRNDNEFW